MHFPIDRKAHTSAFDKPVMRASLRCWWGDINQKMGLLRWFDLVTQAPQGNAPLVELEMVM